MDIFEPNNLDLINFNKKNYEESVLQPIVSVKRKRNLVINRDQRYSKRIKIRKEEQLKVFNSCDKRTKISEFTQGEFLEMFGLCNSATRSHKISLDFQLEFTKQRNQSEVTIANINKQFSEMEFITSRMQFDYPFLKNSLEKGDSFDANQNVIVHKHKKNELQIMRKISSLDYAKMRKDMLCRMNKFLKTEINELKETKDYIQERKETLMRANATLKEKIKDLLKKKMIIEGVPEMVFE